MLDLYILFIPLLLRREDMIPKLPSFLLKVGLSCTCARDSLVADHVIFAYLSGRLYQVEYAMEAIGHAGTCLGVLASDGVVLAAERKNTNKLLDEVVFSEKIYRLHELVKERASCVCTYMCV